MKLFYEITIVSVFEGSTPKGILKPFNDCADIEQDLEWQVLRIRLATQESNPGSFNSQPNELTSWPTPTPFSLQ